MVGDPLLDTESRLIQRAKDHKVEKQNHNGSSTEELKRERERKAGQHVIGTKQGMERRRAGTFYNPSVQSCAPVG